MTVHLGRNRQGVIVSCSCRACGLEWKASRLEDCPRCAGEPCSVCGQRPAVCVDAEHKGTYWLCGTCVAEELDDLRNETARADSYFRTAMDQVELITKLEVGLEDAKDVLKAYPALVEMLRGDRDDCRQAYLRLEAWAKNTPRRHASACWTIVAFTDLGVGGPLASCSCGFDDLADWQRERLA